MNLVELVDRGNARRTPDRDVQVTQRLIRFLVQEEVLLPPTGGRKHAVYPEENVDRLRVYMEMRRYNQSIERIRNALNSGAVSMEIAPGFLVVADPAAGDAPLDPEAIAAAVVDIVETVNTLRARKKENTDAQ